MQGGQMALQRAQPVEIIRLHDAGDLAQLDAQRPVEQNLLQKVDLGLPVQAVARFGRAFGPEQPDLIVIPQGARAHPGKLCQRMDAVLHRFHLLGFSIKADAAARSSLFSQNLLLPAANCGII